jgi:hypothetical protein
MLLNYYTEFLTATIYNRSGLLKNDDYKQIIAIYCKVIQENTNHGWLKIYKIKDDPESKSKHITAPFFESYFFASAKFRRFGKLLLQ